MPAFRQKLSTMLICCYSLITVSAQLAMSSAYNKLKISGICVVVNIPVWQDSLNKVDRSFMKMENMSGLLTQP